MARTARPFLSALMVAVVGLAGVGLPAQTGATARGASAAQDASMARALAGFAAIHPIDTHTHVFQSAPAFSAMLRQLHLHVVDICVVDDPSPDRRLEPQLSQAFGVIRQSRGHASLCTTFDPYKFNQAGFAQQAEQQLNRNFAEGAIAVKIWKNIGMEIKRPDGQYVMPDDPALEPIYRDIAAHHKTLIAHIAEPDSCWQPPNPASPDYSYYKENPQWYMYRHPDHPAKATILAARDRMLAENPNLRVVGAHLGSMETDVDEVARHFDRYPNFAVDTAARIPYLMLQPRDKVRAFLIKYQDRVLYGTDLELLPNENAQKKSGWWRQTYARDWRFFATDEVIEYDGHKIRGLDLPRPVLEKLYHDNAVRWIPGVLGASTE